MCDLRLLLTPSRTRVARARKPAQGEVLEKTKEKQTPKRRTKDLHQTRYLRPKSMHVGLLCELHEEHFRL
ncbi:hypothetical protein AHF37_11304 [Paragonimus kellicotti]|nr:hypothetical protein AHF37_11304 [Paragonimus kellicotti]